MPLPTDECRWGFLSTAAIARKNWRALAKSVTGRVAGVASRNAESAQRFIEECQFSSPQRVMPKAYGSYEELLADPEIDAVYIPLPTALRKQWILAAAHAGKHILAEKPSAPTAADLEEILTVCRQQNVQFMDGVMFMHSSRLPLLREALEGAQGIGPLHRIATQFSFMSNEEFRKSNIRSNSNYEPHGALGDLGWYNLRLILWANNWRMPTEIRAKCLSTIQGQESPKPVPAEFSAELFFEGGPSASMFCSFLAEHQQWAHFSGARGSVWVDDFVLPFYGSEVGFDVVRPEFRVEGCDFHMHRRSRRVGAPEYAAGFAGAQEVAMFETFQQAARSKEPDERWGQMTLATQRLLDAVFLAAGCQL